MSNSKPIKIVGVGHAAVDHLALVDRLPEFGSQHELGEFSIQGSGTVATALATLANFGVATVFGGKTSDDDFGNFISNSLTGLGVELTGLVVQKSCVSPYNFIMVDRNTAKRAVLKTAGSLEPMGKQEIRGVLLADATLLLIDGRQVQAQAQIAEIAQDEGIKVVLCIENKSDGIGELISLSDVLIASERFALETMPRGELEDALRELSRLGPDVVALTMGADGSIVSYEDQVVRQPALAVDVVDTTGAGDVFAGAFCYGIAQSWSYDKVLKFAGCAASLSCRALGARAGLPDLTEVESNL